MCLSICYSLTGVQFFHTLYVKRPRGVCIGLHKMLQSLCLIILAHLKCLHYLCIQQLALGVSLLSL